MKVTLIYFRESGKYFSTGDYFTETKTFFGVVKEIEKMFEEGINPGLENNQRINKKLDCVVEAFGIPFLIKHNDNLNRLVIE